MAVSYANQKKVTVKKVKSDRAHPYALFSLEGLERAMKELRNDSFKLWAYLNSNQDGFSFYLSKVDCNQAGIINYREAVKNLIEKGFLRSVGSNDYVFYELPECLQQQTGNAITFTPEAVEATKKLQQLFRQMDQAEPIEDEYSLPF